MKQIDLDKKYEQLLKIRIKCATQIAKRHSLFDLLRKNVFDTRGILISSILRNHNRRANRFRVNKNSLILTKVRLGLFCNHQVKWVGNTKIYSHRECEKCQTEKWV